MGMLTSYLTMTTAGNGYGDFLLLAPVEKKYAVSKQLSRSTRPLVKCDGCDSGDGCFLIFSSVGENIRANKRGFQFEMPQSILIPNLCFQLEQFNSLSCLT